MTDQAKDAAAAIRATRDDLARAITALEFREHPELEKRYGPEGRDKSTQDAAYHLAYLAEAVAAAEPRLYVDYLGWAKVVLARRNVLPEDLHSHIECLTRVVREELPARLLAAVDPFLEAGLERLPGLPDDLPSLIEPDHPHAVLAHQYLQALLDGDRRRAAALVMDAVEGNVPVRDLYLHVFQRTQHEVGRLWQTNQINVAQEHYCTAATQLIMSRLYPWVFTGERSDRTMVATCVAGDLHELGIRMVADFFEMEGWNTFYLGANTPTRSVLQTLDDREAELLAISATITYHVPQVERLIGEVRSRPELASVSVLVGGFPFIRSPDLWRQVGADGFAPDAEGAIALAARLAADPGSG